jgi:putative ABC transport system substrate-binding protein
MYNPTSNLLQPAVGAVASAARQAGIPLVNADEDAVRKAVAPASLAVGYEQVGYNAGKIAVQILKGAAAESIAPTRPSFEDHTAVISRKAVKAFGMQIPAALANCNCIVD